METQRTTLIDADNGVVGEVLESWIRLQSQNPSLQSPYFSPQFSHIVALSRKNVQMAVVREGGEIVAIFPFERHPWNFAGPVGSFISDYHGVISQPDFAFEPRELLRSCGLVAWDFNHMPVEQVCFTPFHHEQNRSPIIDLAGGYEAYVHERREAGTEQIKKNGNLLRRLEREVGVVRFVACSPDRSLLEQLLAWKTEQFRRNRWRDLFSIPWVKQTIVGIHETQTPGFAGMLSALYAGDRLIAAHFGMRSSNIWHYWFPSYDYAFSKYSPGVMLLLKMAETASAMGIRTIDLGCGEHTYKDRLMNGFVSTANGSVELRCPSTAARKIWYPISRIPFKVRSLISKTPIGSLARRIRDGAT